MGYRYSVAILGFGLLAVVLAGAMTGCGRSAGQRDDVGLAGGIHLPRGADPSRAEYAFHAELVSDARLVRQHTTPRWQLGRFGYLPGDDDVLVITRITRLPEFGERGGELVDSFIERAWIAIPPTAEVGEVVKLEDLEAQRRVGYDVGRVDGPGQFSRSFRIVGTVSVIEQHEDELEIAVDLEVRPKDARNWTVTELYTLPRDGELVYATRADAARVASAHREPRPDWTSLFDDEDEPAETDPIARADDTANGQQQAEGDTDDQQTAAAQQDDSEEENTIVGRWIGQTDRFQLRLQIEDDGEFVFASTRGGGNYAPGIRKGTYRIDGNWLTMTVDSYTFEGQRQSAFFNRPFRDMNLRKTWENGELRLTGDYLDREGHMDVTFNRADFPDMNNVLPPRGWVEKEELVLSEPEDDQE